MTSETLHSAEFTKFLCMEEKKKQQCTQPLWGGKATISSDDHFVGKKNYLITYLQLQMVSDKLHPGNLELTGAARKKPEPRDMASNSQLSAGPAEKSYPPVAKPPCSGPSALCYPESIKSSWLP